MTQIAGHQGRTAFRELMTALVDYAGLFPPAGLPMNQAWESYRHDRKGQDSWMLGRFICPVSRLEEWKTQLGAEDVGIDLSLLGGPPGEWSAFAQRCDERFTQAKRELAPLHDRVKVGCWELRLPDLAAGVKAGPHLQKVAEGLEDEIDFYCEVQPSPDQDELQLLMEILQELHKNRSADAGFKLRCGGLTAEAFPDALELARIMHACHGARVPLKLTAGLHHPLPSRRNGLPMHGFVNVICAATALGTYGLRERDLLPLLRETNSGAFRLDEGSLSWRELRFEAHELRETRLKLLRSFGSCSFLDPREDLAAMDWHQMKTL